MSELIFPKPDEFRADQVATDPILRYFHYAHLPAQLQGVSSQFCALAAFLVREIPRNAERTVALRKLLEAKDAAVRANVPEPGAKRAETFYDLLLAESKELESRLEKLDIFCAGPNFAALPHDQRTLMLDQLAAMSDYSRILGRRIAALTAGTQGQAQAVEQIDDNVRITGGNHSEEPIPFID